MRFANCQRSYRRHLHLKEGATEHRWLLLAMASSVVCGGGDLLM
jgi:hypothetical protein